MPHVMNRTTDRLPSPRRRLWRTLFRRPRKLRRFAPRISLEEVIRRQPDPAEIAHWGEVMLLEDLALVLHRDGTASWRCHVITMPWGDQNLAEWDEITRVFDPRKWYPTIRRAVVHLPDKTRRNAKKVIAPVSPTERGMSLTFAPLRPGVIVEFEEQQDHFRQGEVGPSVWEQFLLQSLFPCMRRRITVAVAEPFSATIKLHHCDWQPAESRWRGHRVYRWDLRDVEGIETDVWTPPPRDFAPWVDISTLPAWEPVARHYRKELLPTREAPQSVRQLARELADGCNTDREKILAVYRYAARDVRYGRHPSEQTMNTIREPGRMLEDLRGDCKDKSSLMVMLLEEMNVSAEIAVLLTGQNGRTPMLPSLRFDHAIVVAYVDGKQLWLDPASGPYTFGDLPQNDQGIKALVLDAKEPRLVDVPEDQPREQLVRRICHGQLNESGDYCFDADVTTCAERGAIYRTMLLDRNDDHRRRTIQQSVAEERPGADVEEVRLGDVEDLGKDVTFGYRVVLRRWARRIEDLLLFRIPWAEPIEFSGPVSAAERLQPLQTPPVMRLVERHEIALPPGFAGYGLPFEVRHECRWAAYHSRITFQDSRLVCDRQMDTRGGIVPAAAFSEFKRFWEECARADRADVVLIRREGHGDWPT